MAIDYIFIHGGNKQSPSIASYAGWYYGHRFGDTCYGLPYMTDYTGDGSDWGKYLDHLKTHRPRLALVMDYRSEQETDTMLLRCLDVSAIGIMPVVVAKFAGCLKTIPHFANYDGNMMPIRIGVSVPTGYMNEGYIPSPIELKSSNPDVFPDRHLHLLGGHPDQWRTLMNAYSAVGAEVASIDGNASFQEARRGKLWSRWGGYKQLPINKYDTRAITICSLRNAVRYINSELPAKPTKRVQNAKVQAGLLPKQLPLF